MGKEGLQKFGQEKESKGAGKKSRRMGLLLGSKSFSSLGGALTSSSSNSMTGSKNVGTGIGGVTLVGFFNEFVGMRGIGGCGSLEFLVVPS